MGEYEEAPVNILKDPGAPTQKEKDEHHMWIAKHALSNARISMQHGAALRDLLTLIATRKSGN